MFVVAIFAHLINLVNILCSIVFCPGFDDDFDDILPERWSSYDNTWKLFDREDKKRIAEVIKNGLFITVIYVAIFNTTRSDVLEADIGVQGLNLALLFRTAFVDSVFMPFFALIVVTFNSSYIRLRLRQNYTIARSTRISLGEQYGYIPFEVLHDSNYLITEREEEEMKWKEPRQKWWTSIFGFFGSTSHKTNGYCGSISITNTLLVNRLNGLKE